MLPFGRLFERPKAGNEPPPPAAHGGAAGTREGAEQREDFPAQDGVARRKVGERLHGNCLYDLAVVIQVLEHPRDRARSPCARASPQQHLGRMPAQFCSAVVVAARQRLVWLKPLGCRRVTFSAASAQRIRTRTSAWLSPPITVASSDGLARTSRTTRSDCPIDLRSPPARWRSRSRMAYPAGSRGAAVAELGKAGIDFLVGSRVSG
jgi:hypothetical protein